MSFDVVSMRLSDFKNPLDAFFWLGSYAGHYQLPSDTPQVFESNTEESAISKELSLCEIADFAVFDTETSGLSSTDCAVQTAVGFFDSDGKALGFYDKLWKLPPGKKIGYGAFKIHKISEKKVEAHGYRAAPELRKLKHMFSTMKKRKKMIVSHNASFDTRILLQTAKQNGVDWTLTKDDVFCTMKQSKVFCGLKSISTGRDKCPTNAELYKVLTGEEPTCALHDAKADITVTARSYHEGRKRGWWRS